MPPLPVGGPGFSFGAGCRRRPRRLGRFQLEAAGAHVRAAEERDLERFRRAVGDALSARRGRHNRGRLLVSPVVPGQRPPPPQGPPPRTAGTRGAGAVIGTNSQNMLMWCRILCKPLVGLRNCYRCTATTVGISGASARGLTTAAHSRTPNVPYRQTSTTFADCGKKNQSISLVFLPRRLYRNPPLSPLPRTKLKLTPLPKFAPIPTVASTFIPSIEMTTNSTISTSTSHGGMSNSGEGSENHAGFTFMAVVGEADMVSSCLVRSSISSLRGDENPFFGFSLLDECSAEDVRCDRESTTT